jgi:hypothetical protein
MLQLTLQPMPRPMPLEMSPTTQPMLPTFRETSSQTQNRMQVLNLLQYKLTKHKEASVNV